MTTKEKVLRLAEAAGFQQVTFNPSGFTGIFACVAGQNLEPEITKLIDLAKQAEREECAKLCIQWGNGRVPDGGGNALRNAAEAIRNRERKE